MRRPIVNSRDEPHSTASAYRRLHVITGDANLCEVAALLKMGTTALVLAMIEGGILDDGDLTLASPVKAMHDVSHDLSLSTPLELTSGTTITALELQWELYDRAVIFAEKRGLAELGPPEIGALVLERWSRVLEGLERDPATLASQLDWVAKHELVNAYRARHGCEIDDPRVAAVALQYHDLRPERSLFARLKTERLVSEEDVMNAVNDPPTTTRAYFRGECLKRYGSSIIAANWDSIVFDVGEATLRRVPMMEPLRGSAAHVGTLLDECSTAAELVARLEG